jgi:prophage regulatory protein
MSRSTALLNLKVDAAIKEQAEMEDGAPDKAGPRRMLNEKQVRQIVPVSRTTLWEMERKDHFPKSTYISPNRRVWFEDEIVAWQKEIDGRGRSRRNHPSGSKS